MKQEDKELLLKDLSARLPYHIKADFYGEAEEQQCIDTVDSIYWVEKNKYEVVIGQYGLPIESVKPYLFPLSSVTEEQYYEMMNCSSEDCLDHMKTLKSLRECTDFTHWPLYEYRVIDWFHKNHFDYRGLIEKGLAIDATKLSIY